MFLFKYKFLFTYMPKPCSQKQDIALIHKLDIVPIRNQDVSLIQNKTVLVFKAKTLFIHKTRQRCYWQYIGCMQTTQSRTLCPFKQHCSSSGPRHCSYSQARRKHVLAPTGLCYYKKITKLQSSKTHVIYLSIYLYIYIYIYFFCFSQRGQQHCTG